LTRNQSQTAVGLDAFFNGPRGADAQALLDAIFALDPSNLGAVADQLSGSLHPQSNHVALAVTESTLRLIQDRLGSVGGGFAAGGSLASLSNAGARFQVAALDELYDDGTSVAQAGGSGGTGPVSLWVRGFGQLADADSTIDAPGFSTTSGGVLVGADFKVNENLLAGIAGSYAHTSVSFNQGAGSTDLDSFLLAPYGKISSGDWYVSGVLGIGFEDFSTTRHISFPGFSASASSSHGGMAYGGYFETGYNFRPGNFIVTPVVGFDATHVSTDSFKESGGGGADLAVTSANSDSAAASLGVRLSGRVEGSGGTFTPEAHAIYRHDFLTDRQKVGETFVQVPSGGTFTVVSSRFGKDAILAGVGINYDFSATSKLFATYDGNFSSGFTAHTVSAGFRMKF
jgi:outer membrane autotransporter protein